MSLKKNFLERIVKVESGKRIQIALTLSEIKILYADYLKTLKTWSFPKICYSTPHQTLLAVKREKCEIGPYENISFFESANRIATDLTLLKGVIDILQNNCNLARATVKLCLGNIHLKEHGDFTIIAGNQHFEGEAFDTAPSFFKVKMSATLSKWKKTGIKKLGYVVFNESVLDDDSCRKYVDGKQNEYQHITFHSVKSEDDEGENNG